MKTATMDIEPDVEDSTSATGSAVDDDANDTSDIDSAEEERKRTRHCITGRGITLKMLMSDGVMDYGDGVMTIEYLGKKFKADLLENGKIKWVNAAGQSLYFNSPSAWAINCKKIVNPQKKSGCGWASVKYKGKKLDIYKSAWFRKVRPNQAVLTGPSEDNGRYGNSDQAEEADHESNDETDSKHSSFSQPLPKKKKTSNKYNVSNGAKKSNPGTPTTTSVPYHKVAERKSDQDTKILVESLSFDVLGKIQPFTMTVSSNCLLIMDFHSHLTSSEVVGYLGGRWDSSSQHMTIEQAFPCKCRLGDKDNAHLTEDEIKYAMDRKGLQLVGWYHSHPQSQADPSLRDLDCQMDYQIKMKGTGSSSYHPCVGMIVSSFDPANTDVESSIKAYWVMPPPEVWYSHAYQNKTRDYGMPMDMIFQMKQERFLSESVLSDLRSLGEFYQRAPDLVDFKSLWQPGVTNLDKLKSSIKKKFSMDQADGQLLDYISKLLTA
ncbi:unnamed protein product [Owenia fusiformis]|uniref:Uncharacterized protein n=1 Tax=Owenia fusiformis TaxID=6347 RepID=A0A8J1XPW0_OWEFU|nr:unnamed protein product [Owenia fusiformis]